MVEMVPEAVRIACSDGYRLGGHYFNRTRRSAAGEGVVILNPATGVLARYYHRYAAFLAEHGFDVLTYDYRGIGLSSPASIRKFAVRWRDWGALDCQAAIGFAHSRSAGAPLMLVGHSFGGVAPGYAADGYRLHRMLTIGAQFAWCGDYALRKRLQLILKWHVAMPVLSLACGYFPGRRLGWLEDLPRGVALDWAFRTPHLESVSLPEERRSALARFASVSAPILAIGISDDELGTPSALARTLDLYRGAQRCGVMLDPARLGFERIGHFDLFHDRHRSGFWLDSLLWLRDGVNPWPEQVFYPPATGFTSSALPAAWQAY